MTLRQIIVTLNQCGRPSLIYDMAARGLRTAAEGLSAQFSLPNSWWLRELHGRSDRIRALTGHRGFNAKWE